MVKKMKMRRSFGTYGPTAHTVLMTIMCRRSIRSLHKLENVYRIEGNFGEHEINFGKMAPR